MQHNKAMNIELTGMAVAGNPIEARALFEQAWALRRDDYDACNAAHFVARHQASAGPTLYRNCRHKTFTQSRYAQTHARSTGV
jgi:hypothetical protein